MKNENIRYLIASLSARNDYISANELASYLHTTTRTIRNYVRQINQDYQEEVILTSHKGYRFNAAHSLVPLLDEEEEFDTPDKRSSHILRELCFLDTLKQEPLSITSLCDEMSVSQRTLEIDLESVRKTLKEFNVALHIRKESLTVSGKESDLRSLIFHLIADQKDFLQVSHLEAVYPAMSFQTLIPSMEDILSNSGLSIDAYHILPLILRIIIQLMRV
ncbi:MAG: HTH domain-containing protein, partial [Erysipelotrichaceae bacterium]|nr:HTH domain-containing protein [Erysipelotrichaceae bacterium]